MKLVLHWCWVHCGRHTWRKGDADESVVVGTGCGQGQDNEDMFNCVSWGWLMSAWCGNLVVFVAEVEMACGDLVVSLRRWATVFECCIDDDGLNVHRMVTLTLTRLQAKHES